MSDELLRAVLDRQPPLPWEHGGKIPWHEEAFSRRILREHLDPSHDRASRRQALVDRQVRWLHEVGLGPGAVRILDLGCGPGLYCAGLAALGHSCTGIDFSPASIAYAAREAARRSLDCHYRRADLRDDELGAGFDGALMLFGELGTFAPDEACALLARVGAALVPGARLVLELDTEEAVRRRGEAAPSWWTRERSVFADAPHLVLRESSWHEADRASVERSFVLEPGREPVVMSSTTRIYEGDELTAMLRDAGFEARERYPCLTGAPEPIDPGLFVIVARRAG